MTQGLHPLPDKVNAIVDAPAPTNVMAPPELVLLTEHLADSPVTAPQIRSWTRRDPKLAPVVQALQYGWPDAGKTNSALAPYFSRKTELSLFEG